MTETIPILLAAYLLGSVSFAILVARVYGLPEGPSTTKYHGQVGHIVE